MCETNKTHEQKKNYVAHVPATVPGLRSVTLSSFSCKETCMVASNNSGRITVLGAVRLEAVGGMGMTLKLVKVAETLRLACKIPNNRLRLLSSPVERE